jgi:hypothetical protein
MDAKIKQAIETKNTNAMILLLDKKLKTYRRTKPSQRGYVSPLFKEMRTLLRELNACGETEAAISTLFNLASLSSLESADRGEGVKLLVEIAYGEIKKGNLVNAKNATNAAIDQCPFEDLPEFNSVASLCVVVNMASDVQRLNSRGITVAQAKEQNCGIITKQLKDPALFALSTWLEQGCKGPLPPMAILAGTPKELQVNLG